MKWVMMMVLLLEFTGRGSTIALVDRFKTYRSARFLWFKSIGSHRFEEAMFSKRMTLQLEMN